ALPAAPRKFTLRDRYPISNDDEGRREQSKSKCGLRLGKPEADEDHGDIEQGDRDYLGSYGIESQRTRCHQDNGNDGEEPRSQVCLANNSAGLERSTVLHPA